MADSMVVQWDAQTVVRRAVWSVENLAAQMVVCWAGRSVGRSAVLSVAQKAALTAAQ